MGFSDGSMCQTVDAFRGFGARRSVKYYTLHYVVYESPYAAEEEHLSRKTRCPLPQESEHIHRHILKVRKVAIYVTISVKINHLNCYH